MSKKTELQSFHVINHSKCMIAAFQNFRQDETMLDVTLACNGNSLKAHKIVLSACSPYFKTLFADNPCKHPIVILKDVEFADLKAIIDFMYRGELSVPRERLVPTLKVAEELQVRGLKSSESTRKNYEKMYKKICEKQHQRKRRKKQKVSSDSENNSGSVSIDSDQESVQSDDSFRDAFAEGFAHDTSLLNTDFKKPDVKQTLNQTKEARPVVLHVGEPSVNTDDNVKENAVITSESCIEENSSFIDLEKASEDLVGAMENHASESLLQEASTSVNSPFESFITCPDKSEHSNAVDLSSEVGQSDIQDVTPVADINLTSETEIPSCSKDCSSPVSHSETSVPEALNHSKEAASNAKERGSIVGFECRICERVFTSRAVLLRHEVYIHKVTDSNLPFKCHYCPFSFKKGSHLKKHMLVHSKKSPYKCSVCSKGFKTERHLQQHSCVHTDEKPYSCGSCSSEFKHSRSLITHRRIHRQYTPFMCRYCCKRFFRGCDLIQHEKTCQGKLKPSRFKILNVKNLPET